MVFHTSYCCVLPKKKDPKKLLRLDQTLLKGVAPDVVLIHVLIGVTNNVLTKI